MTYDEIDPAMRQAIGAFEVLRRFGFRSEDIFFHQNDEAESRASGGREPPRMMFVVLKVKGKDFTIRVGVVDLPYEAWAKRWTEVATAARDRTIPPEELDRIVDESYARRIMVQLMMAIQDKGIHVPVTGMGMS